jgi:DNA polymerase-3 subunit alpha
MDETSLYRQRLETELSVIEGMGYVEYFLIVWDFIDYAKRSGIAVGPGRGSAAGSIVAYSLAITEIDPIKYNLIFERFLNPERVSMPDIDIDFCIERRQEVIDYVTRKYGRDKVSQIITFGTLKAKAAVRDIARALDATYQEGDEIAKAIPNELGITIAKALDVNPDLRRRYENEPLVKQVLDLSMALEGLPRHASTHAAGIVISKLPLDDYVPLYSSDKGVATQFNMTTIEELGLLKMDFLGLRNLTVIRDALRMIKANHGVDIDWSEGIIATEHNGIQHLFDYKGKLVYEVIFQDIRELSYNTMRVDSDGKEIWESTECYAYIDYNNKEGLMDKNYKVLTPPLFHDIKARGKHIFFATFGEYNDKFGTLIDNHGKPIR